MDSAGNMCIVVMFSPRNVTSSQEAIDFIKLISQGAASTRIPCLLPVIDSERYHTLAYSPKKFCEWEHEQLMTGGSGATTNVNASIDSDTGNASNGMNSYHNLTNDNDAVSTNDNDYITNSFIYSYLVIIILLYFIFLNS